MRLKPAERMLVKHVERGEFLDLAGRRPVDESGMRSWDKSRTVRAHVVRDIMRGRLAPAPDPRGLRLRGAVITGRIDLENVTSSVPLKLVDCLLEEGLVATDARLTTIELIQCRLEHASEPAASFEGLNATRLGLKGTIIVGHSDQGTIRLLGARIDGELVLAGATIYNDSGPALMGDGLHVGRDLHLTDGFKALGTGPDGAVRLVGTRVGGDVSLEGASLRNDSGPALTANRARVGQDLLLNRFTAVGGGNRVTVLLRSVRAEGGFEFEPDRLEHVLNPRLRLNINGLVYPGLPWGTSAREWLQLLRDGTPHYAAQPYQQLAAIHRAAGHDGDARRILIAQRRDQIRRNAITGRAERTWARLTGLTLGYGYQPWRALLGLSATVITAVLLALVLGAHGGLARPQAKTTPAPLRCTVVERVGFGLDVGTPLITTGARSRCDATSTLAGQTLEITGWVLRLLAWAFATLFIAGFTGAVRKT